MSSSEPPNVSADAEVETAARNLAADLAQFWQDRLGDSLLGVYLIGSLAHGGFNRRYSDIDVALLTEEGLSESLIAACRDEAARLAPDLAPKLSLFWADRGFTKGRFPPLDRLDYLDRAVILAERERVVPPRPTLSEVRAYLSGRPFTAWAERAAHFAALDRLEPADHKPYLRSQLYPARFVFSWRTGDVASNDVAVASVGADPPVGLDPGPIERAMAVRLAAADPDELFGDRGRLPGQVAACRTLMLL
ncbi:MAG: nucleotidyltransferase domain-containing protein [Alphaproteobacteria bacterium]|nr:nucleotidyltransferase domain-containing protein [Alphaproteobacteria bacterium]